MKTVVHLVAGARPNFMKVAPVLHALAREDWCRPVFVHTGQHYDYAMSGAFLRDLSLPEPAHHLGVGSGSHAEQTAGIMIGYERLCLAEPPDWVVVVGDTNSTMACALAAKKLCRNVAHLEAGLRSRNRTMPEEINRLVTDAIADLLWTPSPDADANLAREGVPASAIERVGNVMIDAYEMLSARIAATPVPGDAGIGGEPFAVVTLHRPSNVDDARQLGAIVVALRAVSERVRLVFPMHPRTQARLEEFGLAAELATPRIAITGPLGYVEFMALLRGAKFALTDSGGLQEETTYLRIPCLTLRSETERPITVTEGSNRLIEIAAIEAAVAAIERGEHACLGPPALWDGKTAGRIVASLRRRAV